MVGYREAVLETFPHERRLFQRLTLLGCDELISEEEEFCPSCGEKLPEEVFAEREQSPLSVFCEQAIAEMGVNPIPVSYTRLDVYMRQVFLYNHIGINPVEHGFAHLFNTPAADVFAVFQDKLCGSILRTP